MPEGVYDNITQMWFGTKEKMGWIEAPQTGANVSPLGNSSNGTLLDGGAFQRNSWDAHKTYQFGWSDSASRALSSKIHSYANGTYGRGLIYFQDPMYYDTNLMPRRIADPSMSLDYEAPSWLSAIVPTSTPTPVNSLDLPVQTTIYNLPAGYVHDPADSVWIPIPDGMELWLGAVYTSTNANAGIVVDNGTTKSLLTQLPVGGTAVTSQSFSGIAGVNVYPGYAGSNAASATISVSATTVRFRTIRGNETYVNNSTNPNFATVSGGVPVGAIATGGAVVPTITQSTDNPHSTSPYFARYTLNTGGAATGIGVFDATPEIGVTYTMVMMVRSPSRDLVVNVRIRGTSAPSPVALPAGVWTLVATTMTTTAGATNQTGLLIPASSSPAVGDIIDVGAHGFITVADPTVPYTGLPFSGDTVDAGFINTWNGTPNASASTRVNVGSILNGPWTAGEGHSGCRFDGRPTLVNYNGIGGGQVGLAASFKEVGSWS